MNGNIHTFVSRISFLRWNITYIKTTNQILEIVFNELMPDAQKIIFAVK